MQRFPSGVLPAFSLLFVVCAPASAATGAASAPQSMRSGISTPSAPVNLECVPYARRASGIQLYGDAHTWWDQAEGRYPRGNTPRIGAVMAIRPYKNSALGHVATVTRIVDSRTILISHANWSAPGEIEREVTALDVSPRNDWSEVRIWYAPAGNLGAAHWPVSGFIYPKGFTAAANGRIANAGGPSKASPSKGGLGKGSRDPIAAIIAGRH